MENKILGRNELIARTVRVESFKTGPSELLRGVSFFHACSKYRQLFDR